MSAIERILTVPIVVFLATALLALAPAGIVQASPQFGGDCHYCHTSEQPDALAITGYTEILDGLKVFDVEPGGSVDFGLDVNNPGAPTFFRTVLRGLDRNPSTALPNTSRAFTRPIPIQPGKRRAPAVSNICSGQASTTARIWRSRRRRITIISKSARMWCRGCMI